MGYITRTGRKMHCVDAHREGKRYVALEASKYSHEGLRRLFEANARINDFQRAVGFLDYD